MKEKRKTTLKVIFMIIKGYQIKSKYELILFFFSVIQKSLMSPLTYPIWVTTFVQQMEAS